MLVNSHIKPRVYVTRDLGDNESAIAWIFIRDKRRNVPKNGHLLSDLYMTDAKRAAWNTSGANSPGAIWALWATARQEGRCQIGQMTAVWNAMTVIWLCSILELIYSTRHRFFDLIGAQTNPSLYNLYNRHRWWRPYMSLWILSKISKKSLIWWSDKGQAN